MVTWLFWVGAGGGVLFLVSFALLVRLSTGWLKELDRVVVQLRRDTDYMLGLGKRVYTDKEKSVIMYFRGLPPSETSSFLGYQIWCKNNDDWKPHLADLVTYQHVKGLFREGCR